jgi:DNA-binding HxlR family transcriptional regulator
MTDRKKTHIDQKDMLIMILIKNGNPSVHEMRAAIQANSPGTIAERLKWLQEQGLVIQPRFRQPRSRRLTDYGFQVLYEADLISKEEYEKIQLSSGAASPP